MHSSRELRSSSFEISVDGRPARLEELFEGFGEHDRLGVVMTRLCGAVGASALISATITAFYDIQRARGPDFFIYPDYYLFHVDRPLGDHARLDVWPHRKEVVVPEEPERILEAIVDRAITRLAVEEGEPGEAFDPETAYSPEAVASARVRIVTCLAYSPSGRVADADVHIASNSVTEGYVEAILDPESRLAQLRGRARSKASEGDANAIAARVAAIEARIGEVSPEARRRIRLARSDLLEGGVPVERYRRIGLDEALGLLGSRLGQRAGRPPGGGLTRERPPLGQRAGRPRVAG